jgi:amidase
MKKRQEVNQPTKEEMQKAAKDLYFTMQEDELQMYSEFMGGLLRDVNFVNNFKQPLNDRKYPRGKVTRPTQKDNPYNAWYQKCIIKGASEGKLKGKTIVIKDNISVADVPMMNGSDVYEGFVPDEDATIVTRILDEGGEILGKAVCENFCFSGGSHTSATGPVRNPHNEKYMTGGSSSGCAALIVGGHSDMGVGSDQGGSVRMPASFSGCYGIKPTYGLVPYTGAGGIEESVDHLGPMAASTEDCALLLEVIAGYDDGRDPRQKIRRESQSFTKNLDLGIEGLKIGIVEEGFGTPSSESDVDDEVKRSAQELRQLGAQVEDISIPMHLQGGAIMMTSILDGTLSTFSDNGPFGPAGRGYKSPNAIEFYQNARKERADKMPVTVKTVLLFGQIMRARYGNYYSAKAQNLVRLLTEAYDEVFKQHDLIIMPTTPMKAHLIPPVNATPATILGNALDMLANTCPFDSTGHPSMSIPVGTSGGLPIGMMITGRMGEDDMVLRAAQAFEKLKGET